ncbi:hypothetical protein MLD38_034812 [Melastoma candidum]|uniref:Uncharacterized protein n=1 Tax=Melastoma candidum TaxID=119954 RepID=A0ACB9MCY8_9MYRT|nr:hypothetical protein MLD38_034812 [Melastoma candidum]
MFARKGLYVIISGVLEHYIELVVPGYPSSMVQRTSLGHNHKKTVARATEDLLLGFVVPAGETGACHLGQFLMRKAA